MTRLRSSALSIVFWTLLSTPSALGCSAVDPSVGLPQGSCAAAAEIPSGGGGAGGSSGYGGAKGSSPASSGTLACMADAGSACDNCEDRWCCPTRLACYSDPVCRCADSTLDHCLPDNPDGGWSAVVAGCWDTFSSRGAVEKARVACLRAWCQAPCAVP
jgi:hypothetical protein